MDTDIKETLDTILQTMSSMDKKLDAKFGAMETKISSMESKINAMAEDVHDTKLTVDVISAVLERQGKDISKLKIIK
jgi:hypothetical protein